MSILLLLLENPAPAAVVPVVGPIPTIASGAPGWGQGGWGQEPWGGAVGTGLQLVSALAVRENVIRLKFSHGVYFSRILDPGDASAIQRYTVTATTGTVGMDGSPVRAVAVVATAIAPTVGEYAQSIDLTLDRAMTPFPATYTVAVNGIFTADQSTSLDITATSYEFPAVFANLVVPSVDFAVKTRDFANPQTLKGAQDPLPNPYDPLNLGTIVVDDTGDYAFDEGVESFKKRMYRRLITVPGGFVHLGETYGVGVLQHGKKLGHASLKTQLAAQAELQIGKEPEVAACKVRVESDFNTPGLTRFIILVKLRSGQTSKFSVPFHT